MNQSKCTTLFLALFLCLFVTPVVNSQETGKFSSMDRVFQSKPIPEVISENLLSGSINQRFKNPAVFRFEDGCRSNNINNDKFAPSLSFESKVLFCEAFQEVANNLNSTDWSPELREELQNIWQVFIEENVKIRPMRRGLSKRIALAAEPFTRRESSMGFNASIYVRPKYAKKKSFFLLAMHELRHIYDFYQLWSTNSSYTEAEMEKRGFRIMGRIARETRQNEKFKRLPKVWKDSWAKYTEDKIRSTVESKIESFMRKSGFYRSRLKYPNRFMISFTHRRRAYDQYLASIRKPFEKRKSKRADNNAFALNNNPEKAKRALEHGKLTVTAAQNSSVLENKQNSFNETKVASSTTFADNSKNSNKTENSTFDSVEPLAEPQTFINENGMAQAQNKKSPADLLGAARLNEKRLYSKMENFKYDEDFQLQCLKNERVAEKYTGQRTVNRNNQSNGYISLGYLNNSSCVKNSGAIKTDVTETFWSASYLEEVPIEFDFFTVVNGKDVAQYTVLKTPQNEFKMIASKYPHIKPLRLFFGRIYVSVEDSQIIKFEGTTYSVEEADEDETEAKYVSTAIRQKLYDGLWVTTSVNTSPVSFSKTKKQPFRLIVKYRNYRKSDLNF